MSNPLTTRLSAKSAALREKYEPLADNGFFGPGSVTWKVWSYPSSIVIGFSRAVTIEQLDPNLIAAVEDAGGVRYRPRTRYERTVRYFALAAFGDTASSAKAADVLVKVHSKAIGTDPVTGGRYDANNPASQLWIHMTAWHSILYCYELFGPGKLTEEEELQYWEECARAAQLQTIDPADVPRSRDEVRAYFEDWRPRVAASEAAQSMTDFILHSEIAFPEELPRSLELFRIPLARLFRKAVVATYPRYIRKMFGLSQSRATDVAVRWFFRAAHAALVRNSLLYATVGDLIIPTTMPIVAPVILGIPAKSPITMTPREAQKLYGYDIPSEAHKDLRAKQEQRVFSAGEAPSDEGLIESQQYIGSMNSKAS
jgi:uncharacterized protein (DUF2236 family)